MQQAPQVLRLDQLVAGWQRPATAPLSLVLHRGEVIGLSGPNGTGKSTVLAAISGKARIFSGTLLRSPDCRISLHPQQPCPVQGLPLSGHELLSVTGARTDGLPVWLLNKLDHRMDQLSGGQRQYLALWALLNRAADLILLDEPSNHLDAAGSTHLASAIRQRAGQGAAILLISHEPELLATCCDRIIPLQAASTTPGAE